MDFAGLCGGGDGGLIASLAFAVALLANPVLVIVLHCFCTTYSALDPSAVPDQHVPLIAMCVAGGLL